LTLLLNSIRLPHLFEYLRSNDTLSKSA